jgi:hypothetical protein
LHPTSLRDWSEDNDDELEPPAALGPTALHVAAAATSRRRILPVMELSNSPARQPAAMEPTTWKRLGAGQPPRRRDPSGP